MDIEEPDQITDLSRFKKNFTGINERIAQASEMCRFLSRFAHRMDQPHSSFSVSEVMEEEIYLLRRFAWQKQVEIDFSAEENLPSIINDPALLQFTVFCIIWPVLEQVKQGSRIFITVERQDETVRIVFNFGGTAKYPESDNPWLEALQDAIQVLGAKKAHRTDQNGHDEITLTVSSVVVP